VSGTSACLGFTAHRPVSADLSLRTATHRDFWGGPTSLPPPENGASAFSGRKKCQHFPGETRFPRGAPLKLAPNPNTTHPVAKFHNREPKFTLCIIGKRASYALRTRLPSPWVHSPSGPRFWTLTWSGPEFPTPLNPMQPEAPPPFLRDQHVPATYSTSLLS
jgi:hypothetical protein